MVFNTKNMRSIDGMQVKLPITSFITCNHCFESVVHPLVLKFDPSLDEPITHLCPGLYEECQNIDKYLHETYGFPINSLNDLNYVSNHELSNEDQIDLDHHINYMYPIRFIGNKDPHFL